MMPHQFIQKYKRGIAIMMLIPMVIYLSGCHYMKVVHTPVSAQSVQDGLERNDYFILHYDDQVIHLRDIKIDEDNEQLTGTMEEVKPEHRIYQKTLKDTTRRIFKYRQGKMNPKIEIHLFASEPQIDGAQVTLPLSRIQKIDVYDVAMGATIASYVFTSIGIVAGVLIIVVIIALATKSSCPFVFIKDGKEYRMQGEVFSGAIYPSLERNDYLPLTLSGHPEFVELDIRNLLEEIQYINYAGLCVVDHPLHSKVVVDKSGRFYSVEKPRIPLTATVASGKDWNTSVSEADSLYYSFQDAHSSNTADNALVLEFDKDPGQTEARLVVNAKNSLWLDYMYGRFNKQFGIYYNRFAKSQAKKSKDENIQWYLDQHIPLMVEVETVSGWKQVDYYDVVGPVAAREMAMNIPLSEVPGHKVKVRLTTGYNFWEIDQVYLDASDQDDLEWSRIQAASAKDEEGKELKDRIASDDPLYVVQKEIGNTLSLKFKNLPVPDGMRRSYFLHSKGYYQYIRDYTSWPDIVRLRSFKKKGGFEKFSFEEYNRLLQKKEFPIVVNQN